MFSLPGWSQPKLFIIKHTQECHFTVKVNLKSHNIASCNFPSYIILAKGKEHFYPLFSSSSPRSNILNRGNFVSQHQLSCLRMDKVGEDNIPSTTVYNTIPSNGAHTNCIAIVYQVGEGTVYIIDILALTLSPLLSVYPPPPHSSLEICCENVNTWRLKYPEQIGAYTFSTSSNVCWETHLQVIFLMSSI